jgi:hypothetical protein
MNVPITYLPADGGNRFRYLANLAGRYISP